MEILLEQIFNLRLGRRLRRQFQLTTTTQHNLLPPSTQRLFASSLITKVMQTQEHSESTNSTNAKILSGIQIQISGLTQIRIQMSARLLPKCIGFSCWHKSCCQVSLKLAGDCMRNANIPYSTIVREMEKLKVIRNPYP